MHEVYPYSNTVYLGYLNIDQFCIDIINALQSIIVTVFKLECLSEEFIQKDAFRIHLLPVLSKFIESLVEQPLNLLAVMIEVLSPMETGS